MILTTQGLAYSQYSNSIIEYSSECTVIEDGDETMIIDVIDGSGEHKMIFQSFIN
jgi:hypothetical protein